MWRENTATLLQFMGPLVEDMDLIAVPWVESASEATTLKDALTEHIGACGYAELLERDSPWLTEPQRKQIVSKECDAPDGRHYKPHGRIGWNLYLYAGAKADLSIMPRLTSPESPVGGMARHIRALESIIEDAAQLLAEIMRDEVNHQDEAEKWLRAYAPHHLFPENGQTPQ